ncbi:U3 small nucleolar ribonucleoprotein protein MPP10, putative [Hepatocystis sp. ex Piliocolobus tephrosceles]|nr:U3 small nucleolar ribonucleoprotein protein MPP10, putative [Hepatocystis sp. ex Piliocolobus tephrosceles]
MEEIRLKKYSELIKSFYDKNEDSPNSGKYTEEEKNGLLEMVEYFSNILIKYFYNAELEDVCISNSGFDCEQLWYFIECIIKEKNVEELLTFFTKYEKKIDTENKKNIYMQNNIDDVNLQSTDLVSVESYSDNYNNSDISMNKKDIAIDNFGKKVKKHIEKKSKSKKKSKQKSKISKITTDNVDSKDINEKKNKNINVVTNENEDIFFNYEEMDKFLITEENKIKNEDNSSRDDGSRDDGSRDDDSRDDEDSNDDEQDLNNFNCDYDDVKQMKYDGFYKREGVESEDVSGEDDDGEDVSGEDDSGEDDDGEDVSGEDDSGEDDDGEDVSGEDDSGEDDDGEDDSGEDDDDNDYDSDNDNGEMSLNPKRNIKSSAKNKKYDEKIEGELYDMNRFSLDNITEEQEGYKTHDQTYDDQNLKEQIEKELIEKKHWSLTGEVSANQRPHNSILSLNVDIPKINTYNNNDTYLNKTIGNDNGEYDTDGSNNNNGEQKKKKKISNLLNDEIEHVVKQRIKNLLFDDVEKKRIEDLEIYEKKNDEVNFDNLNFSKSKLSLADEYAKQYVEEIKNNSNTKNKELNLQKIELINMFQKVMYCCDSLSNNYFIPKPVLLNVNNDKIASLQIEENVPIIVSDKNKKTPEELMKPVNIKDKNEMTKKEKKTLRKLKKEKRKKHLLGKYKETPDGIKELHKRCNYISDKNKKEKENKQNIMKFGVKSKESLFNVKTKNRYDFAKDITQVLENEKKRKNKVTQ